MPDVSAVGMNFPIYTANNSNATLGECASKLALIDGTSASTPLFASVVALINDARIKANKSSIGFINPALYANPQLFNDITNGSNPGCNYAGFNATEGWDAVTGMSCHIAIHYIKEFMINILCSFNNIIFLLIYYISYTLCILIGLGTPNFPKLLSYFLSLGNKVYNYTNETIAPTWAFTPQPNTTIQVNYPDFGVPSNVAPTGGFQTSNPNLTIPTLSSSA